MGRKPIEFDVEKAKRLYVSGKNLREVAIEFGVSAPTIYRRFKNENIPMRKQMFLFEEDRFSEQAEEEHFRTYMGG